VFPITPYGDMAKPKKFGEKLDAAMRARRMTRTELGRLVDIAQPKISAMTSGHQRPYLDQGHAIAHALGVPLDWLADDA
jgi:transcriptional regulator with XRE-family HTH domain